jgi:hypothetical protein
MARRKWGALLLTVLAADGVAGAAPGLPPRNRTALLGWLRAGAYQATYTPEPAVHESATGVHGRHVRTWYSPTLVEDLRAGRPAFRKGAAMVKELYFGGTEEVVGWSVMRKVRRRSGPGGRGWLFYEALDGTNRDAYFGRGLAVCAGCHRDGTDFLRSDFRP